MIKLSFFSTRFHLQAITIPVSSTASRTEHLAARTFFSVLVSPSSAHRTVFTFTRTCVAQEPTWLKSSACFLTVFSLHRPCLSLVLQTLHPHSAPRHPHCLRDTECTAHDWNQLSHWDSLVTCLTPLKPQISQRVRSVDLDTSSSLMKETHQQCLKCETTYCSFEASSPYVSKNRSSWDSQRIDPDFARSETAELDARRQFPRNSWRA